MQQDLFLRIVVRILQSAGPFLLAAGVVTAQPPAPEAKPPTGRTVEDLQSQLQVIPPQEGGGYVVDSFSLDLKDNEVERVVQVPGIRIVQFADLAPDSFTHLARIKKLEGLWSNDLLVSDQVGFLHQMKHLESLDLEGWYNAEPWSQKPPSPAFLSGLNALEDMQELRHVRLVSDKVTDEVLAQIGKAPGLWSLQLSGHFTNAGLKSLGKLTSLRRLSLIGHFDDDGLAGLAGLAHLECLSLASDELKGNGLAHLAALPRLKMLRLGTVRPGLTLAPLKDWPTLQTLDAGCDRLSDDVLLTLPESDRITSLSLRVAPVTTRGLAALPRLRRLEELDLIITPTTDTGLEIVSSLPELRALCLGSKGITEAGLRTLARLRHLERLDLRYVDLTHVDLQVLALPTLTMLHLEGMSLPDGRQEELRILRSRLPMLARPSSRVVLRSTLFNERDCLDFDVFGNRFAVEL